MMNHLNIPIWQMGEKKIINVDWFPIIFFKYVLISSSKKNEQQIFKGT